MAGFVAVYEATRSDIDHDLFFGVFSPSGTLVAPAGDIDVPGGAGSRRETRPDVAALRDGGFVVVWTDPDDPNLPSDPTTDIRASILSNAGTAVTSNILVNTTRDGAHSANVVGLRDGGFLVTWDCPASWDAPRLTRGGVEQFDAWCEVSHTDQRRPIFK